MFPRSLAFCSSGCSNGRVVSSLRLFRGPLLDLEPFRSYLMLLARMRLDRKLQGKVGASDIVQQTLLEAHQAAEVLRGQDVVTQAAWLRRILARNLANAVRDLGRHKRDVRRERSLQAA